MRKTIFLIFLSIKHSRMTRTRDQSLFSIKRNSPLLILILSFLIGGNLYAKTDGDKYLAFDENGEKFSSIVKPFFNDYCVSCHGPKKEKGSLRVDQLTSDLNDQYSLSHFQNIIDELTVQNMPPEDEKQPSSKKVLEVIELLSQYLKAGKDKYSSGGGKPVRRLSRSEYVNTVWDQLGVHITTNGLPEDLQTGSFETDAENLYMTDMHFKAYLSKSREVVKKFIASRNMKPGLREIPVKYHTLLRKHSSFIFVARNTPPAGSMKIQTKWWKRDPSKKSLVSIGLDELGLEHEITGTATSPQTIEFDVFLPDSNLKWLIKRSTIPSKRASKGLTKEEAEERDKYFSKHKRANKKNLIKVQEYRSIHPIILGEIKNFQNISHQPYDFFSSFLKNGDNLNDSDAPAIIKNFVTLIKRGQSVDSSYLTKLNTIFTLGRQQGMSFWEALEEPFAISMCSLDVIYHFEDRNSTKKDRTISGIELANRLAYNLWRSTPDSELIKLGQNGELLTAEVKEQQIQRMMKDKKFDRFLHDFTIQYFELQRQDLIAVDGHLFRKFDQLFKPAMKNETIQFLSHLVKNNLSLTNLVDSDFMMLNNTIARHYGIPGIYGNNFRAVSRKDHAAAQLRGGILTHAGILMQGGTGDRTSIVERGAFVARKIINRAPAPPPPNAGELPTEEADTAKMTGAELVRHHASSPQCRNCHAKIDPLGIGLEQFDAIGRFRTEETRIDPSSKNKKTTIKVPLETKGNLYDGKTFNGVVEMKRVLMTKKHDLTKGFIKALLAFTGGRGASFADESIADSISTKVSKSNYLTRDIIEEVMSSKAITRY